jgi:uncharacterized protein (DUF302 family)
MFNSAIEWYDDGAEDASLSGLATGSDYGASRGSRAARGGRHAEFLSPGVIMREYLLAAIILLFSLPANAADNGIISKPSGSSVSETLDRLEKVVKAKGLTVFARVDHSTEAEKVGLKLPPMQLLIFGNPKTGTAMMNASPTIGIDLPLKALAWEDRNGQVWLSYNSPDYLQRRHDLKEEFLKNLAAVGALIDEALK